MQNECADRMCRSNVQIECALERMCTGTNVQNGGVTDPCAEQMCRAMFQNGSQIADRFLTLIPRHRIKRAYSLAVMSFV